MSVLSIERWDTGAVIYKSEATDLLMLVKMAARDEVDMYRACLDGAHLDGAHLVGAHLVGASLVGAHLVGASLVGANLDRANLVGARLDRANLDGARLDKEKLPIIQIGGSCDWITMLGAMDVRIGCKHHPLEWWMEHYAAVGRLEGYTVEQVSEYKSYLDLLAARCDVHAATSKESTHV